MDQFNFSHLDKHWIIEEDYDSYIFKCPRCDTKIPVPSKKWFEFYSFKYCPVCGSRIFGSPGV